MQIGRKRSCDIRPECVKLQVWHANWSENLACKLVGKDHVTFDQNVSKYKIEIDILLMYHTEKIDGFNQLEVLIVHFDELRSFNLEFHVNF